MNFGYLQLNKNIRKIDAKFRKLTWIERLSFKAIGFNKSLSGEKMYKGENNIFLGLDWYVTISTIDNRVNKILLQRTKSSPYKSTFTDLKKEFDFVSEYLSINFKKPSKKEIHHFIWNKDWGDVEIILDTAGLRLYILNKERDLK